MEVKDSTEQVKEPTKIETRWATEMKPYQLRWNGRDLSILLPEGTRYNKGMLTQTDDKGVTTNSFDWADGADGIPVPKPGKVPLQVEYKTEKVDGENVSITKITMVAQLTLSQLPKDTVAKDFLNGLKKEGVQVLAESEQGIVTKAKTAFSSIFPMLEKTMIEGDLLLQIRLPSFRPEADAPSVQLLEKINFVPKASPSAEKN